MMGGLADPSQMQIELGREIPNVGDAEPRPTFGKVHQLATI
jgi:hypothetical protein